MIQSQMYIWAIQKLLEGTFSSLSQTVALMEPGKTESRWLPGSARWPWCKTHASAFAAVEAGAGLQAHKELVQDIFITIVLGFSPNELFQEHALLMKHTASLNFHVILV